MKSRQPATQARLVLVARLPTLAMASSGRALRVTFGSQKTGCANRLFRVFKGPFPVCESMPRTTWVQGFPRDATKIKVDAEHPARMPAPLLELSL